MGRDAIELLEAAVLTDECEEVLVSALVERQIEDLKVRMDPYADRLRIDVEAVLASNTALANRIISRVEERVNHWDLWETHRAESL